MVTSLLIHAPQNTAVTDSQPPANTDQICRKSASPVVRLYIAQGREGKTTTSSPATLQGSEGKGTHKFTDI
jgi:hypothetical protein